MRRAPHPRLQVGPKKLTKPICDLTERLMGAPAADNSWVGTWFSSTLGMVAADALAIGLGVVLGRRLPDRVIGYGAAVLFFILVSVHSLGGFRGTHA